MKFFLYIVFLLFSVNCHSQNHQEQYEIYKYYYDTYNNGDYLKARRILEPLLLIEPDSIYIDQRILLHNIGIVSGKLDQNEDALSYLEMSEKYCDPPSVSPFHLVINYNSRANIYQDLNDFQKSALYFEKALSILNKHKVNSKEYYEYLTMLYLNYGIMNYKRKDYEIANEYLHKSLGLRLGYNLNNIYNIYLNLGKVADRTSKYDKAKEFYKLAIEAIIDKYGKEYYLLRDLYLELAELFILTKEFEKAEANIQKSLDLSLKVYEVHHTDLAAGYQIFGDLYVAQEKYEKALEYYQTALRSIHPGFTGIESNLNPPADGSLNDIWYIDILRSKAQSLYKQSLFEQDIGKSSEFLTIALNTIQTAINVKTNVQNSYASRESRMYLSENEKKLYTDGIKYAIRLCELENEEKYKEDAYYFASLYKANELKKTIYSRQAINRIENRDSLYGELNIVRQSIRQYSNYLLQEEQNLNPDSIKISRWKNELFSLNRLFDSLQAKAQTKDWYDKVHKEIEVLSSEQIQSRLKPDQSLVDYVISSDDADSSREVFMFVLTKNDFYISKYKLDQKFNNSLNYYLNSLSKRPEYNTSLSNYDSLKHASYDLYSKLFYPIEHLLKGAEVIIIPDEDLLILPFESLITNYVKEDIINFSGLPYLINDYCVSYAFSGSLAFQEVNIKVRKPHVTAFAPGIGLISELDNLVLEKAREEINVTAKLFNGDYYYDSNATKTNFLQNNNEKNIFHFAMHSNRELFLETEGYLEFYPDGSDSKLWGYEISFLDIESPLIVLSGCNTGLGMINKGEGVFSLSRNFLEAGAQSVIQTLWSVDDGSSSAIIQEFYKNLARAKKKNISLYRAKKQYLSNASPFFSHPYYWSGIQLLGNTEAVIKAKWKRLAAMGLLLLIAGLIYFVRRRNFRKRTFASD